LISKNVFGFELNGRVLTYYLIFAGSAAMILALLRIVNSPFGRVLQQSAKTASAPKRSASAPCFI